jgi:DNA helicase-2/ATP-dependent DNA helicase PcrA
MMRSLLELPAVRTVTGITEEVIKRTGYLQSLAQDKSTESVNRQENVQEFLSVTTEFDVSSDEKTLQAFLEQVSLVSDLDNMDQTANSVTLMTLHAAKGLEFPVVFLVGMEEGVLPHSRSLNSDEELEEERRLCYVGITRAREMLYLSHAYRRTLFGNTNYNPPSRFLRDIPEELYESKSVVSSFVPAPQSPPVRTPLWNNGPEIPQKREQQQVDRRSMRPGIKVSHAAFGVGVVLSVQTTEDDLMISVAFPGRGVKKLLQSIANLQVVS